MMRLETALMTGEAKDLAAWQRQYKQQEGATITPAKPGQKQTEKLTLAEQRKKFLEFKKNMKKRDRTPLDAETLEAYSQQTEEFLSVCNRDYSDEITGEELRDYMNALERRGLSQRSICNHYTSIGCFLKFCGVDHKNLLPKNERPVPDDGTPEAYTEHEMKKFFASVSDERQCLAFELLLKTGLREREMTTLEWTDLSFGDNPTLVIQARKPHLRFRTKTGKGRTIPLEKTLAEKLQLWRDKNPGKKLVFGTCNDKEDSHFYRHCQKAVKRAELNSEDFWLHKFRASFCTWSLQRGVDIRTVRDWAGHSSITQTERYLAPAQGTRAQVLMNQAFGAQT